MGNLDSINKRPKVAVTKDAVEGEREREMLAQARMGLFRREIVDLAIRSKVLYGIDPGKLTDIDLVYFNKFNRGEFTLEDIRRQQNILINLLPKTESSLKLFHYMEEELRSSQS